MKFIYKVRKKYLYENKVQFANLRAKENLSISKDGLHYIEKEGLAISNYIKLRGITHEQNDKKLFTKDYYLNLVSLNTPTLNLFSTEKLRDHARKQMKNYNVFEKIIYMPRFNNYVIFMNGVSINGDNPITGDIGDIIGIEKSIDILDSYSTTISLNNKTETLNFFSKLLQECDEQYIISKNEGILSAIVDGNQLVKSNFDINDYISNYIYQYHSKSKIENNNFYGKCLYFINIERTKKMDVIHVSFDKTEIKINTINTNSLFLSEETFDVNFLDGNLATIRKGEFDLLTFDNSNLEYNEDIKIKKKRKFFNF